MYELYKGEVKVAPVPTQYSTKVYRERGDKTPGLLFIFRHEMSHLYISVAVFLEKSRRFPSDRGLNGK
jgi:hypothetical protein